MDRRLPHRLTLALGSTAAGVALGLWFNELRASIAPLVSAHSPDDSLALLLGLTLALATFVLD